MSNKIMTRNITQKDCNATLRSLRTSHGVCPPVLEYALRDINKPIGISDYELGQALPKDLRSSLPSIEDIEAEFDKK